MEIGGGYRPKTHNSNQINHLKSPMISLNLHTLLVHKLPDPSFLLVFLRLLLLAMVIIALPCIRSVLRGPSGSVFDAIDFHQNSISLEFWNLLWQDFAKEGLIKKGHKALVLSAAIGGVGDGGSMFVNNDEIDVVVEPDLERQSSLPDEVFDFVFVSGSLDSRFVDRVVKIGGVIAMQLGDDISIGYQKRSDYRMVYLRKYTSTIVAMKKLGSNNHSMDSSAKRRLCRLTLEAKKAALKGLEDVLFEPPRRPLAKSNAYVKKINFLPDLLGDSLEHYPRRVFIDVGSPEDKNIVMNWFDKNYPRRNQEFEVYSFEMGLSGGDQGIRKVTPGIDVSDWLMRNAREEEFIVMKAEAEVVEKMIERGAIALVDELFLECHNQWQDRSKKKNKKSKRAYWECLSLYGRLRDEVSIPVVSKVPTIILGMDVSHGSPGQSDVPSIAAVVSSRQWPLISRYRASVRTQSPKLEMIDSLFKRVSDKEDEGIVREVLLDFYTSSGKRKPDQIIIFRDGVSESQFNQVLNIELDQVIEACKFLDENWNPKFVVIVAQKNHHTKFFQQGSPDNVPPGTVIDNKICHPKNNDFYLCAHAGMIGTTRPTHYHVLLDQIGFSADDLQELVHSLSYVYQRSTTAISVVAPICYAHLAASQVGTFIKFEDASETSSNHGGVTAPGAASVPQLPRLKENVCNSMFFC